MKRILVAMALVLMTAGTAMAHGGVNFSIGVGIPLYYPYSYPTYYNPAPYGYYYPGPAYGYYYSGPSFVYRSYPYYGYYGGRYYHRGYGGHGYYNRGNYGHYGYGHGNRHGR